jgi:hypothetical protein
VDNSEELNSIGQAMSLNSIVNQNSNSAARSGPVPERTTHRCGHVPPRFLHHLLPYAAAALVFIMGSPRAFAVSGRVQQVSLGTCVQSGQGSGNVSRALAEMG